jgi:hypothetical protein
MCQMWEVHEISAGWHGLRNVESSLCLDVDSALTSDGAPVIGFGCDLATNQLWQFVCTGNNRFHLIAQHSSSLMEVASASTLDGAVLEQKSDTGGSEQDWQVEHRSMVFSPVLPTSEADPGRQWRYTTSNPAGGWQAPAFDDSGWAQDFAGFGDNAAVLGNVRTSWASTRISLRQAFTLASVPASLDLRIYHSCAANVYVNNALIYTETRNTTGYVRIALSGAAMSNFIVGQNVVAASCQGPTPRFIDLGFGSYSW